MLSSSTKRIVVRDEYTRRPHSEPEMVEARRLASVESHPQVQRGIRRTTTRDERLTRSRPVVTAGSPPLSEGRASSACAQPCVIRARKVESLARVPLIRSCRAALKLGGTTGTDDNAGPPRVFARSGLFVSAPRNTLLLADTTDGIPPHGSRRAASLIRFRLFWRTFT